MATPGMNSISTSTWAAASATSAAAQFLTNVTTSHSYTTYYIALNFKDNGKK